MLNVRQLPFHEEPLKYYGGIIFFPGDSSAALVTAVVFLYPLVICDKGRRDISQKLFLRCHVILTHDILFKSEQLKYDKRLSKFICEVLLF